MDSQKDWPDETLDPNPLNPRTAHAQVANWPPVHLACMGLAWHV